MSLTDVKARTAKSGEKAYKLADGKGLSLLVHPNGSKYWRLKYRHAGKEKQLALGVYPEVTLAHARELTLEARGLLKIGQDPVIERKATKARTAESAAVTFEAVAREWMESRADKWARTYAEKVEGILGNNLFPRIGALPVTSITAPMLLGALRPIEARGALEVAARARQWAGEVFRYAIATGRATDDPATVLRGALKVGQTRHYPALRREEVGAFMRTLLEYPGRPETRLALQILMLTFVRPGELRAAHWAEFKFDTAEWRIPPERMKARVEHVVPLSLQSLALLKELHSLTGHGPYLFPGGHSRVPYMSENTLNKAIDVMGYKGRVVGHGFRATASTIMNESGDFAPDVIERQLAHAERNKVRAAYHRAEYLAERRRLMQVWADLLDSLRASAGVTPLPESMLHSSSSSPATNKAQSRRLMAN